MAKHPHLPPLNFLAPQPASKAFNILFISYGLKLYGIRILSVCGEPRVTGHSTVNKYGTSINIF